MLAQLLALSAEAFAACRFDTSYHILAAALHWVDAEKDGAGLLVVERAAAEQIAFIDVQEPGYHHSTVSAQARGFDGIFRLLERQASVKRQLVERAAGANSPSKEA